MTPGLSDICQDPSRVEQKAGAQHTGQSTQFITVPRAVPASWAGGGSGCVGGVHIRHCCWRLISAALGMAALCPGVVITLNKVTSCLSLRFSSVN